MHRDEEECRACSDFQSFMRQRRLVAQQEQKQAQSQSASYTQASPKDATTNKDVSAQPKSFGSTFDREECPLDRDQLGNRTWSFLHTMAAYYPKQPTVEQQKQMHLFFNLFSQFYPCSHCAEDFRRDIQLHPPQTQNRQRLSDWLCQVHNLTNKKLGKPAFDCSKVLERWRDGWKDGRCDTTS